MVRCVFQSKAYVDYFVEIGLYGSAMYLIIYLYLCNFIYELVLLFILWFLATGTKSPQFWGFMVN